MAGNDKTALRRRDLLGLLAAGGITAVAAATPSNADAAFVSESRSDKRKARYHVTDDIKAYYRVNRYPAQKG